MKKEDVLYRGFTKNGGLAIGLPEFRKNLTLITDNYIYTEIIPETLSRFTGKNDCNGNPVFEGDIVRYGYMDHDTGKEEYEDYLVQWDREQACFCLSLPGNYFEDGLSGMEYFEVVGNVYKTPELAKQFDSVRKGI